jgi:hypothetical protein
LQNNPKPCRDVPFHLLESVVFFFFLFRKCMFIFKRRGVTKNTLPSNLFQKQRCGDDNLSNADSIQNDVNLTHPGTKFPYNTTVKKPSNQLFPLILYICRDTLESPSNKKLFCTICHMPKYLYHNHMMCCNTKRHKSNSFGDKVSIQHNCEKTAKINSKKPIEQETIPQVPNIPHS